MEQRDNREDIETEEKPNVMRELLGMLVYVGIVLAITFLIITFVGQRTHVSGESMENTLDDGDQLIVDKLTYRFHDPERFDIIVFPFRYKDNTYYIKRIIGLRVRPCRLQMVRFISTERCLRNPMAARSCRTQDWLRSPLP